MRILCKWTGTTVTAGGGELWEVFFGVCFFLGGGNEQVSSRGGGGGTSIGFEQVRTYIMYKNNNTNFIFIHHTKHLHSTKVIF